MSCMLGLCDGREVVYSLVRASFGWHALHILDPVGKDAE